MNSAVLLYIAQGKYAILKGAPGYFRSDDDMRNDDRTAKLMMTAMMTALILMATLFLKIPIAVGYIHLGDAMIFLAAMMLPKKHACLAGTLGAALADIMGGFSIWAPWTVVIKLLMVLIMHSALTRAANSHSSVKLPIAELIGFIISGIISVTGYYIAEGFLYGNWTAPLIGVPFNLLQAAVGAILAVVISTMLYRTPMRDAFFYIRNSGNAKP